MTPTRPDAADAGVLSDRDIAVITQTIEEARAHSLLVGPSHQNTLIWLLGDVDLLLASHRALAAERDRLTAIVNSMRRWDCKEAGCLCDDPVIITALQGADDE